MDAISKIHMKSLQEIYKTEIVPTFKKELGYTNDLAVPKISKITINVGIGEIKVNPKIINTISQDLYLITGQKPQIKEAKKSISGFKIRKGDIVGLKITLRRKKMYNFLEKLIRIVFPRVKDFRGISQKSIDNQANITIPIKEHIVFPEIEYEKVESIYGLQITITTTTSKKDHVVKLLNTLGFPLENK